MLSWAVRVIVLAFAGLLTGWLALSTGDPTGPGYVIWPLTGIGLVGLLAGGSKLWPGVWFPAFVFAFLGHDSATPDLGRSAVLATAYTVQAAMGAWLICRWVGYPTRLVQFQDVIVFLFLAGPIHTVLTPAIGVAIGAAAGEWSGAAVPAAFRGWWWGDAAGGAVFGSIALVLVGQPPEVWRPRVLTVAVPLLTAAIVAAVGFLAVRQADDARAAKFTSDEADLATRFLKADLERVMRGLTVVRADSNIYGFNDDTPRPVSDSAKELLGAELRMICRTSELIQSAEIAKFTHKPDQQARKSEPALPLSQDGEECLIIMLAEPRGMFSRMIENDVYADPAKKAAVKKSNRTKQTVATTPVRSPAGSNSDLNSVYLYHTLFANPIDARPSQADPKRQKMEADDPSQESKAVGAVGIGFDFSLVQTALGLGRDSRLRFTMIDPAAEPGPEVRPGDLRVDNSIQFADRNLTLVTVAPAEFLAAQQVRRAGLVSAAGFGMTTLLAALLLTVTGRTAAVAEEVDVRTQALQEEVAAREFTEAWLRASESRLAEAQRIARLGHWEFDPVERLVHLSAEAAELLGEGTEPIKLSWEDLIAMVYPDDRDAVREMVDAAVAVDRSREYEFRVAGAEGEVWWLAAAFRRPEDEDGVLVVQGVLQDVTERKIGELALRASESRLAEAQRVAKLGYWDLDPDTGKTVWSPEMYSICGVEPDTFVPGMETFFDLVHPDDRLGCRTATEEILTSGTTTQLECRIVRPDGLVRHLYEEVQVERDTAGRAVWVTGVTQDVTERKQAEAEKQKFEGRLRETQKLESLGVLAGGVAHDFNNLLTGVLGNASLAREVIPPDSELHEFLRPIEKSAEHAAQLCQQMLAYAGRGTTVRGLVDLNRLAEESADLLRVSVPRTAALRFEPGAGLPVLTADPGQLRQVLLNLVHNAAEALDGKGGTVTVATGAGDEPPVNPDMLIFQCPVWEVATGAGDEPPVNILGTVWSADVPPGPHVWLEVADNGCGMSQGTLARIFEPFFTTKFTGRGLGLSAVHGIVRSHGGAIMVTSTPGEGTRFRVYLPRGETVELPGSLADTPVPAIAAGPPVAGRVALLADDQQIARTTAALALRSQGLTVVEAADGLEALALIREAPDRFAVVVLDMLMPGLDGRDVLRETRRIAPNMPAVLTSGFADSDLGEWAAADDVQFLAKPFRPADLTACVRRLLSSPTQFEPAARTLSDGVR